MSGPSFQTNPIFLHDLLRRCHEGKIQLPDFQRSWVWDEERIKSLIASVSRAFPVGALMTLRTGGPVNFKPRPVEGAPETITPALAEELLLDGQQRMTSLYQVALRGKVVKTKTPKNKPVERWFYLDMRKCLDPNADREAAVVAVPADKIVRSDFNRSIDLDLSTRELEFENLMYPISEIFSWTEWQMACSAHMISKMPTPQEMVQANTFILNFYNEIIVNFAQYQIPVIALGAQTSKAAVCTVFEKVNTGGKALDAFELVTAMYAAEGHELRRDWYGKDGEVGRQHRFKDVMRPGGRTEGILAGVSNTDFLQAITLFHRRKLRREAEAAGKQGKELPPVTPNRQALLDLPLTSYLAWEKQVEAGFVEAAKFVYRLNIYDKDELPYQSQLVGLAAILADLGAKAENDSVRRKLIQWYWSGVFGELYGSASEGRLARDFLEVPAWIDGGDKPSTVQEAVFRADRLNTMRTRLSAAYKGLNALLMNEGAIDWRTGQKYDHTVFFGEAVDIHHVFPKAWCERKKIDPKIYDSIINKTPLGFRTNRIVGGAAPSIYLTKLQSGEDGTTPIEPTKLDVYLSSHLIDPQLLRNDGFKDFMAARKAKLLVLIEAAMDKKAHTEAEGEADEDFADEETIEADLTIAAE